MQSLLVAGLLTAPIVFAACYSGGTARSDSQSVRIASKEAGSDWVSRNTWVYLQDPINVPKAIYGDSDQVSIERPLGDVQQAMMDQKNPVAALSILGKHEADKDRYIMGAWKEYVKPSREIVTYDIDLPTTWVSILKPGSTVDQLVKTGLRFWDQPVPRSTGIDRYYKRVETVPWYLVP